MDPCVRHRRLALDAGHGKRARAKAPGSAPDDVRSGDRQSRSPHTVEPHCPDCEPVVARLGTTAPSFPRARWRLAARRRACCGCSRSVAVWPRFHVFAVPEGGRVHPDRRLGFVCEPSASVGVPQPRAPPSASTPLQLGLLAARFGRSFELVRGRVVRRRSFAPARPGDSVAFSFHRPPLWRSILPHRFDDPGSVAVSEVRGDRFVLAASSLFMFSGPHRFDFQDRVVGIPGRQRVVRAVCHQVEHLEHDLVDPRLAPRRSDDAVGDHCPVRDPDGHGARQQPFVLPPVGIGHHRRSVPIQPEAFDDVLREYQAHLRCRPCRRPSCFGCRSPARGLGRRRRGRPCSPR